MRLVSFRLKSEPGGSIRAGAVDGGSIRDFGPGASVTDLLSSPGRLPSGEVVGLDEAVLAAPVPRPGKILAAIVNSQGMLGGSDVRLLWPRIDMKAPSTVVGPGETIVAPAGGLRPEVELAAVIGSKTYEASVEKAKERISGYTVLNDVTAPADSRDDAYEAYRRDKASGQIRKATLRGPLFRSKNHDTFCPMGPCVVTSDELQDTSSLKMSTKFDGMLVQEGSTSEYLFGPAAIVSYLSGFLTLEPGDVVSCGSVGWTEEAIGGLDPTEYLLPRKPGTLELEIEGIGVLRNPVSYSRPGAPGRRKLK